MISDFSLLRDDFTDLDGPDNDDNVVTSADVTKSISKAVYRRGRAIFSCC